MKHATTTWTYLFNVHFVCVLFEGCCNADLNFKKRSERRKHCVLAVVRHSRKFSPRRRSPSRGRGMAKI